LCAASDRGDIVTDSKSGKDKSGDISRRAFLGTSAGAAAASLLGKSNEAEAQASPTSGRQALPGQSAEAADRDVGNVSPPAVVRAAQRPGSDLMVQVLRDLEIEYVAANPAASFEGLQESIINYGDTPNEMPQFISALHEESSVMRSPRAGRWRCCCTEPSASCIRRWRSTRHFSTRHPLC
jgi:hypothetical protein